MKHRIPGCGAQDPLLTAELTATAAAAALQTCVITLHKGFSVYIKLKSPCNKKGKE
jgi:hypothetical protein